MCIFSPNDKKISCERLTQFLVNRQPVYDKMILGDMEMGLSILDKDLRFISGSERSLLRLRRKNVSLSAIAGMFHWSRSRVSRVLTKAENDVRMKLKAWVCGLPKEKQGEERKKRSTWIGHVEYGVFPIQGEQQTLARFEAVYPKV